MSMEVKIEIASVKVMRSYDYCHFEVSLSTTEAKTPAEVDELRKTAARLADKAVEQYKIMKKVAAEQWTRANVENDIKYIREIPEGQRTVQEKANLKAYEDKRWRERPRYDYEDDYDWDEKDVE